MMAMVRGLASIKRLNFILTLPFQAEDTRHSKESFNAFAGILRTKMQTKEPHTQTEINFMLFYLGRSSLNSINKIDSLEGELKETRAERDKYKMWAYDLSHQMTNMEGATVGVSVNKPSNVFCAYCVLRAKL